MKIKTFTKETKSIEQFNLKTVKVGKLVVFKLDRLIEYSSSKTKDKRIKDTKQGITTQHYISRFTSGKTDDINNKTEWKLGIASFLEDVRKNGWEVCYKDGNFSDAPYDDIISDESKVNNIIKLDGSSHMLFDRSSKPLPVAIHFDYIQAHIDNAHYNLDTAFNILKKNKNIKFIKNRRGECGVLDIPYYNAEVNRDRTIEFMWAPTVEEYRKMWKKCLEYKTEYPSTNKELAIFDLDLLGLRKGKAALFNAFYRSKESD